MKSPTELRLKLRKQWESAVNRESRLLLAEHSWPVVESIGKPSPRLMASDLDAVKRHVEAWRRVSVGEVIWNDINYRATEAPVKLPMQWKLRQPTEWIEASADCAMRDEFKKMTTFAEQADSLFHPLLIRRRSLWRDKNLNEVIQATRLAVALTPNCAEGRPLRTLSLEGIDTKFFERNARLVTALLDVRFDGEVSPIGLETFLGAFTEGDHWLLVVDLDGALLPFRKQRVRSSELKDTAPPGERLLIVENESCQHQVPLMRKTIAVFGAGFDLGWTEARWLPERQVGYWGDIDTWGLQFLARARSSIPKVEALMMGPEVYERHIDMAVPEPVIAGVDVPVGLLASEQALYKRLLKEQRGRLEQEFLASDFVRGTLNAWAG